MQFAQKIFKLNLNWSSFFNAGHYVAFKHRISFATDLAATFGCYRVRIMPVIFYKLLCAAISLCCSIWIWADALFRTGRRFKLLLCTGFDSEHTVLFLCNILLRDQWLIKRWIEAMGAALVGNNFSPIPSKISFHMKTKNAHCCPKFAKHKTFQVSTLELSKYCKSGSMFSSSEPVAASSDCSRLVNALCLCSPVLPAQTVQESGPGPKSLAIDWTFNYLLEQRLKRLPNDRQGLKLGHLNSAAWSTSC